MLSIEWLSSTKRYQARVAQNLFGDWEVCQAWGGRWNRLGGKLTTPLASEEDCLAYIQALTNRRRRRGYAVVNPVPTREEQNQ